MAIVSRSSCDTIEIPEVVFSYIDFCDIANCRLVCKTWYNLSACAFQAKSPALILTAEKLSWHDSHIRRISEFLSLSSNNGQFCKFILVGFSLTMHSTQMELFWSRSGEHIVNLKLQNISVSPADVNQFEKLLLATCLPNLEELVVELVFKPNSNAVYEECAASLDLRGHEKLRKFDCTFITNEYKPGYKLPDGSKYFPCDILNKRWGRLMRRYPKLEHIGVSYGGTYIPNGIHILMKTIGEIRAQKECHMLNLKSLRISDIRHDEAIVEDIPYHLSLLFEQMHVSLTKLSIGCDSSTPAFLIETILASQSISLKELSISTSFENENLERFRVPLMTSVQDLSVHGRVFRDMTFILSFPELCTLTLSLADSYGRKLICKTPENGELDGFTLNKLVSLQCASVQYSGVELLKLARWMPRLAKLRVGATDATFPLICKYWPTLTDLWVHGTLKEDAVLQGLQCRDLRHFRLEPLAVSIDGVRFSAKLVVDGFLRCSKLMSVVLIIQDEVLNKDFIKALQEKLCHVDVCVGFVWGNSTIPICMKCTVVHNAKISMYHPIIRGIKHHYQTCNHVSKLIRDE